MHHPLLAFGFGSPEFVLLIVGLSMIFPAIIVAIALFFKGRERQMWHETARLALEKGQPLPPLPPKRQDGLSRIREHRQKNDIRAGLILIAVGSGLYCFFATAGGHGVAAVGAIPGFIGVALLFFGVCNALFAKKPSAPEERPPQS